MKFYVEFDVFPDEYLVNALYRFYDLIYASHYRIGTISNVTVSYDAVVTLGIARRCNSVSFSS